MNTSRSCISVFLLFGLLLSLTTSAQTGQIGIQRVNQMPDLPSSYEMRDWKQVAIRYDAYIFDLQKTGTHLPLAGLRANGINYPELRPMLLDTYVGSNSPGQAEAINIIPALVGATLNGIDKSGQAGINWVEKAKDFYNSGNGENVYLNGYDATSGKDWWYDLMPNIFFYQLHTQYPATAGFHTQFVSVADRWLQAVRSMGGSTTPWATPGMNYRGWYLRSMTGNAEGVKEPEASGAIAWLLYHAWISTGNKEYREGAQLAMEYLSALAVNPSYELQLPYGTFVAAKMNAELGTHYDVDKMLGWCFDRGPLRGWGAITGTWDGRDVSGVIGEANDQGNDYAFMMNGFQQAAALVPLVKYDKRYAKAIAKWMLNLASASRFFYPKYLAADRQDDHTWSTQFDPESVIAYEALKEQWQGKPLYGTGDAKRSGWAQTNLGLYGSSHAGYLAAVVETTDVSGILKLDLNKTDFFGDRQYPSFLFFNPHTTDQWVTLKLGNGTYKLYDAIRESNMAENATGDFQVQVKAGEVILLTYVPQASVITSRNGKLYAGDHVVDHHYGYDYTPRLRIKSIDVANAPVEVNKQVPVYAAVENATGPVSYNWYVDDVFLTSTSEGMVPWTAPGAGGTHEIKVKAVAGSSSAQDSVVLTVVKVPVTGTADHTPHKAFSIYPNPAVNGVFFVNIPADEIERIEMTDLAGRTCAVTWSSSAGETRIERNAHVSGLFLVSVHTNENIFRAKVIF